MKRILIIVITLLILLGSSFAVYSKLQNDQKNQVDAALKKEVGTFQPENVEAKYIANMLAQVEDVQKMLILAAAKAKHAELRELAGKYLSTTEQEAKVLNNWNARWSYQSTKADENRLPRYISVEEYADIKQRLMVVSGDKFDELFIQYLRIQLLSDDLQSFKINGKAKHKEVEVFANKTSDKRAQISNEQAEWPVQWGYAPPHDG